MGRRNGGAPAKARFYRRQARLHVRVVGDTRPARCRVVANAGCDLAPAAGARRVCTARRDAQQARWCKPGGGGNPVLTPNYIEALLAARDLDTIRHETILQPPPPTLLYLLLRHSLLLEYAAAASRLLINRGYCRPDSGASQSWWICPWDS